MTAPVLLDPPSPISRSLTLLIFIFVFHLLLAFVHHLNYCHSLAAILLHFLFLRDNLKRYLSQSIINLYHQKIIYYPPS